MSYLYTTTHERYRPTRSFSGVTLDLTQDNTLSPTHSTDPHDYIDALNARYGTDPNPFHELLTQNLLIVDDDDPARGHQRFTAVGFLLQLAARQNGNTFSAGEIDGSRVRRVLLAGSRDLPNPLRDTLHQQLEPYLLTGWRLCCGDNPNGADRLAQLLAARQRTLHEVWHPTHQRPRFSTPGALLKGVDASHTRTARDMYLARDLAMIQSPNVDYALFFWNGTSAGTQEGIKTAQQLALPGHVFELKDQAVNHYLVTPPTPTPVSPDFDIL